MLRTLNGVAALAHLGQAVAATGLVAKTDKNSYKWPIAFPGWLKIMDSQTRGVNLGWLIPPFFLLSSVNHSVYYLSESYRNSVIKSRTNPLRWIEYSLSAGLMTFILGNLSGVLELRSLLSLVLSNMAMQYIGWEIEVRKANGATTRELIGLTLIGWLIYMSIWLQVVMSFATVVTLDSKVKAPVIIYAIMTSLFGLFCSFGINQILYIADKISFEKYEMGYVVLSLAAKSVLAWQFLGGITSGKQRFKNTNYEQ